MSKENNIHNTSSKITVLIENNQSFYDIPNRASQGSSGYDLYSSQDVILSAGSITPVKTGIKIAIPRGYEMQVRPRSGLAFKHKITVLNSPGTIDADYRGEILVIMQNFSSSDYQIQRGDRIAQGVFTPILEAEFIPVDTLPVTIRGSQGFGSSGKSGNSQY